jgi:regulator of protease activity HflC (stomatin/prohibitin superfamily)
MEVTTPNTIKHPKFVTGLIIGILSLFFIYNSCFVYIKPNEFGIKKINIGPNRGLVEKIYTTGLNFILPFGFHEMNKLPRHLQVLELTNNVTDYSPGKDYQRAVHIQTSDGFFVDIDVSIIYRIIDPYKVISRVGPGNLYVINGIVPRAEPVLKEALGVLTTEEFYNSHARVAAVKKAEKLLQEELESKGLKVEHILIRYFRYSSEIQRSIEEKKLKDQLVFKNMAEARAATEEAKLKKMVQEGIAIVNIKLEEGQAYILKKNAEKELYVRKNKAEADLLIKLAEARKMELKNEALSSFGSDRRVGLEMAEVFKGINLIMLPSTGEGSFNPLNLEDTIEMLGIKDNE